MKQIFLFLIYISAVFSQDIFPNYPVRLIDNEQTTLHQITNEVTFVSFWATWCIPCIKEIDKINLFIKGFHYYEKKSKKNVVMVFFHQKFSLYITTHVFGEF